MKYLMNLSTHPDDVGKFGAAPEGLLDFLSTHELAGIEVINYSEWQQEILPEHCIVGYHMPFWPLWLPFWHEDSQWLKSTFGDEKTAALYYGGSQKHALVNAFKAQLQTALDMGADYAVFHISHCELEECFSYRFKTKASDVVEAFIELLNLALRAVALPEPFTLLFENQWWPGLDFLDQALMTRLLQGVEHGSLGFMLDTGHFMNSHLDLNSEEEALATLENWYEALLDLKPFVRGIHLSSSLSGAYVKAQAAQYEAGHLDKHPALDQSKPFFDRYFASFDHIGQVDRHQVFEHGGITALINKINPSWLVLEFMTGTKEEADQKIGRQLAVLKTV